MFDILKLKIETSLYSGYYKMNKKRKSKEKNPVYRFFDNVRRGTGFVK